MEDDDSSSSNQLQLHRHQPPPPPSQQAQPQPRRVMIVADPTRESTDALQYAISHALISGDQVILIHVVASPSSQSIALATLSLIQNKRNSLGNLFWKSPPPQTTTTTTSTTPGSSTGEKSDHQVAYLPSWTALSSLFVKFEHMAVGSVAAAVSDHGHHHHHQQHHVVGGGGVCGGGVNCGCGNGGDESTAAATAATEFLESMKRDCESAFPNMRVKIEKVHSGTMDKGSVILFKSMELEIDLLIIGQRRSIASVLLGPTKAIPIPVVKGVVGGVGGGSGSGGGLGGAKTMDTAEYLIEYSECNCVGVQKKAQNAGYLINTKTRKNFWLLA